MPTPTLTQTTLGVQPHKPARPRADVRPEVPISRLRRRFAGPSVLMVGVAGEM